MVRVSLWKVPLHDDASAASATTVGVGGVIGMEVGGVRAGKYIGDEVE
jgi:hypothetical protein